jgi:D-alanyl-D-alanine dipeptidase
MNRTQSVRAIAAAFLSAMLSAGGLAQTPPSSEPASAGPMSEETQSERPPLLITVRPIAELREEALKAKPPEEHGLVRPWLSELTKVDGTIHLDIRYAAANNALGEPVYEQARAYLQVSTAFALKRVNQKLHAKGYGLLVYDAYRPWYVTKIFWEATPGDLRQFAADPEKGSLHNRGCAVDLTLYDLATGAAVAMPSGYEDMTPRADSNYPGGTAEEREHRAILREAMEGEGFVQMPNEWWHFDYKGGDSKGWQKYEIMNLPFHEIPNKADGYAIPPRLLRKTNAKKKHLEGAIVLSGVVDVNGRASDVRVEQSMGQELDEAAIAAMKQMRFVPGKQDGKAVQAETVIEIKFGR